MARTRVLMSNDNQIIRQRLLPTLSAEFDVIQAVGDGGTALMAAAQLLPAVAIVDILHARNQ